VKHVFHYLKGTRTLRITYGGGITEIIGFSDADWGAGVDDQHSVSGYLFQINGGPVSWSSKKQQIIALSSTEAEYITLTHASKEVVWLRSLLGEIYNDELLDRAVTVFSDNKSVISMVKNNIFHSRTKHIAIWYHYIRELYEMKILVISFHGTKNMPADMFMKPLPHLKVEHLSKLVGLAMTWGGVLEYSICADHPGREGNRLVRFSIFISIGLLLYLCSKLLAT
jgi:hypothetical protein